jgi:hypothetical protein
VLDDPPEAGDGKDYDLIGFSLSKGFGYGYFFDNTEWREPYIKAVRDGIRTSVPEGDFQGYNPTTYRPPALPVVLAAIYRVAGRDFRIWRVVETILVAIAVSIAAALALRTGGALAAAAVTWFAVRDPLLVAASTEYMTEGLAVLGVMVLAWSIQRFSENPSAARAAMVGASLAGLTLARSIFVFWYPVLVVLNWWLTRSGPRKNQARALLTVFVAVAIAIPLPWWTRNCLVLEAFMPLGAQGGINLPQAFSDYALRNEGFWKDETPYFDAFSDAFAAMAPIQAEREMARVGTRLAVQWVATHPLDAVRLASMKMAHLWREDVTTRWAVMILAAVGLLALERRSAAILVSLLLANTLSIGLTHWVTGNRFMIPIHLILHLAAAIGMSAAFTKLAGISTNRLARRSAAHM